jgi:hypothetical protein
VGLDYSLGGLDYNLVEVDYSLVEVGCNLVDFAQSFDFEHQDYLIQGPVLLL